MRAVDEGGLPSRALLGGAGARALTGGPRDHDSLIEAAGGARFVLLGEASHGTHEFYRERARITRRLVEDAPETYPSAL